LLKTIQRKIEDVQDVFQKQSTRDGLKQEIYDLLYDERTGLPASKYDNDALGSKTDELFQFFESRYATGPIHAAYS
jgi:type I restriction enzyme R subunit|tara:strand:- start:942 stop:1169 length:228 start_codon:yes stop_codon:yes gene_type:complete